MIKGSGPGLMECIKCAENKYYDSTSKLCLNNCPSGYFENKELRICTPVRYFYIN
jgi:hypothetical protein